MLQHGVIDGRVHAVFGRTLAHPARWLVDQRHLRCGLGFQQALRHGRNVGTGKGGYNINARCSRQNRHLLVHQLPPQSAPMSTAKPADFEPYSASFAADPYPVYARLREHTPVFYSAQLGMTLFTRYDDIRGLLLGSRLGRTLDHLKHPEEIARQRASAEWQRLPNYNRYVRVNLLETEGAEHARVRGVGLGE